MIAVKIIIEGLGLEEYYEQEICNTGNYRVLTFRSRGLAARVC